MLYTMNTKIQRYSLLLLITLCSIATTAQDCLEGVISDVTYKKETSTMEISMAMALDNLDVSSNRAVVLTPYLVGEGDSIELPSVGVYGRRRYYYYKRSYGDDGMIKGKAETWFRAKDVPEVYDYEASVAFEEWMNNSTLTIVRQDYGCCEDIKAECDSALATYKYKKFVPHLTYARPTAEVVKVREDSGVAYVTFPVNSIGIWKEYRENTAELGKIDSDIAKVRDDADMTITSITLKGYASPEGSYSNNERLAKGRVAAVKSYILEGFPEFADTLITTTYEPENWAGLRAYVEQSDLEHKGEIMTIIDSPGAPDVKEGKIKSQYPKEYSELLANCYPALRRTDYVVTYTVRSYTDVEEIRAIFNSKPQKLSLEEFYLLAMHTEPGSEEFNAIWDTAVLYYPNDETANLNAAINAIERGEYSRAAKYLPKAGNSTAAQYANEAYLILTGQKPEPQD